MKTPFPKYDEALVRDIEEHLDMDNLCQPVPQTADRPAWEGLQSWLTRGAASKDFNRAMIQVIDNEKFSGRYLSDEYRQCNACYDFSRTWNCPDHPEKEWTGYGNGWGIQPPAPDVTPRPTSPSLQGILNEYQRLTDHLASQETPLPLRATAERQQFRPSQYRWTPPVPAPTTTRLNDLVNGWGTPHHRTGIAYQGENSLVEIEWDADGS